MVIKQGALHVLLHGENNDTYSGIIILTGNKNTSYKLVPDRSSQPYDNTGAAYYVIVVVLVYGLSIIMLIASHIKRRHDKFVEDRQINRYLQNAPSLKEQSAKARWKELKMSFIPITLATVAIGTPKERCRLQTVNETQEGNGEVTTEMTHDSSKDSNLFSKSSKDTEGEEESTYLLSEKCELTDDENIDDIPESDSELPPDDNTETTILDIPSSPQRRVSFSNNLPIDLSSDAQSNNKVDKNDNQKVFVVPVSPVSGGSKHAAAGNQDAFTRRSPVRSFRGAMKRGSSPPAELRVDTHKPVMPYVPRPSPRSTVENQDRACISSDPCLVDGQVDQQTWVKRSPEKQAGTNQPQSTPEVSRETQL